MQLSDYLIANEIVNDPTISEHSLGGGWARMIIKGVRTSIPKMNRLQVYDAIDTEREYQNEKWGDVGKHPHEVGGWLTIIRSLLFSAERAWASAASDDEALNELRQLAAVAVACGEQHGMPSRKSPDMPPVQQFRR